ncbi:hypothetical protein BDA99DRAFT_543660 [Phascolomyces articulosus]|uniref:Uncharacterized protein n=1 Tax=Phascolomyces articulosus TaxID=60185 RepID=A0AAD5JME2_9FUNG|nr:hypothetical protein BDA99DRAFT_543660 [Phascolomyces articulosus]
MPWCDNCHSEESNIESSDDNDSCYSRSNTPSNIRSQTFYVQNDDHSQLEDSIRSTPLSIINDHNDNYSMEDYDYGYNGEEQQPVISDDNFSEANNETEYDYDLIRELYFEEHNDEHILRRESNSRVQFENEVITMDLQDLPEPSAHEYWNIRLSNIVQDNNLSSAAHESIIDFCNDWRKTPEPFDSIYLANEQMMATFPVESQTYHICKNGCILYENDTDTSCLWCNTSRYQIDNLSKPVATMRYLPLSQLLGSMLASPLYRAMFHETFNNRRSSDSITDIFDGYAFTQQEHLFRNPFSVGLLLFCDGFAPFDAGRTSLSMQLIHLVIEFGILDSNPFTKLSTYHSPYFFGSAEEFHMIGQNISRQILAMLKNQHVNADTPFGLPKWQQALIGKAINESHLLMLIGLDGDVRDVFTRSGSSRAVDYIDFLLYVVPTVVYEVLEENECSDRDSLMNLVNGCSLALQLEISNKEEQAEREGDPEQPSNLERLYLHQWHIFMLNDMPHNLYTINMHMLRHLADSIEVLGTPRTISTRNIERAIGEIKAYIKSRVAPGPNASNALLKIAASRHWNRYYDTHMEDALDQKRQTFQLGDDEQMQFWGPLMHNVPISNYNNYNLRHYIHKYWLRVKESPLDEIDPILGVVAPKLFLNNCEYDCLAFPNSRVKKLTHFVTALIPVDLNAQDPHAESIPVWRRFFCEIVLFFTHSYRGVTRMLCLVKIIENVYQNGAGAAYGSSMHGTRFYVTDVEHIERFAGMIKSLLYPGSVYYIYKGMDIGKMKLGNSHESL